MACKLSSDAVQGPLYVVVPKGKTATVNFGLGDTESLNLQTLPPVRHKPFFLIRLLSVHDYLLHSEVSAFSRQRLYRNFHSSSTVKEF